MKLDSHSFTEGFQDLVFEVITPLNAKYLVSDFSKDQLDSSSKIYKYNLLGHCYVNINLRNIKK